MNILILGSGGREHALAWKIAQSKKLTRLFIAPGNAGTAALGTNLDLPAEDFEAVKQAVLENHIHMVIVGPEAPLVEGIHDFFLDNDDLKEIPVIGPTKAGARLEGSKDFAKLFMLKFNIPTADFRTFLDYTMHEGQKYLATIQPPYVLKADGLAAGKGVLILHDLEEAQQELENMISGKFGAASKKVVVEEFLSGVELSVFVLTDGKGYVVLPEAKDYKRIGEGDTGLNTGGMGAVSPVPFADKTFMEKVEKRIIQPTIEGLISEGIPYRGFIFFGLINVKGDPYVIEYNVRMGDPEAEVVLPRIKSDFVDLLTATAEGTLKEVTLEIDPQTVTTVMLVSGGYPGSYEKNKHISGLEKVDDSIAFHAGTRLAGKEVLTNGGRVIAVSAYGENMRDALSKSYKNAEIIDFEKKNYRKDIGFDL
ncbi:MAG: phosphoribosylamine--glycine ligase [Bacteroidales bacterium]|nr:phosphoribosylamine--glycine ligase [Bacteroidales bacterium]MDT8432744.1 phosphoribosylamine--glycine ligase [Bacteroidales bacterium]